MHRKSIYSFIILSLLILLGSCRDDDLLRGHDDTNGELPVEFNFQWPGLDATRGFDDATVKTRFEDGDVIHIVGTFKTKALLENGDYEYGQTARYGALKYNGKTRQWEAVAGNKLTWPSISTEGRFYAYYLSGSNGLFTNYDEPVTVNLSKVTPETDPLMAPSTGWMVYGHAVNLQFNHLCTYLTLINMEPNVASNYFFTTEEVKDSINGATHVFNNAFTLTLKENAGADNDSLSGTPELKFEFIQVPDTTFTNQIYISGNTTLSTYQDEDGEDKIVTKVGYFLQPGYYETFDVNYPATAPEIYPYLTYNYNDIPDNVGGVGYDNIPPQLEGGRTYTLNITRAPGITIVNPPSAEGWDDEGEFVEVNPEEFLRSVREGQEYTNDKGTRILEKTADGTKLLHNVDFKGFTYEEFLSLGFVPDVLQGNVFDGDHHYIQNLGSPFLRNNYGTIKNLGLKNVKFTGESIEYDTTGEVDNTLDRSRHGALCMWNRSTALISNVRLEGVDMTIKVQYQNTAEDGGEVHNIGCVVGSNTGRINELQLGGAFKLTVTGDDVQNAEVLIGGIIGQNAGNGNLYDASLFDDNFTLNITNKCQGALGLYAIGGIVGKSSGYITGVIMSEVTIDSTGSSGVDSYIGGMAGHLDVTTSTGYLRNCIIGGIVRAGTTKSSDNNFPGQSYIGGMVGYDSQVDVTGCRASVSVNGSSTVSENVTYATGGAVGCIQTAALFENLIAYGPELNAPTGNPTVGANYVGNFAGMCPANQSWTQDYADKNIILRSFNGLRNIGTSND